MQVAPLPDQIGPYRVQREIGRGGMGVVYLARDDRLQRDVAIKAISPRLACDRERLVRFRREARIIAQLNHPHIVQIYQLLEHEGLMYLVLEYVPGESLAQRIGREGAIDLDDALELGVQIARAMEAAHGRGIIHRDLKPANIRVTERGLAKVLDFGIARGRVHRQRDASAPNTDGADRSSGTRAGTPGYMAPEQERGEPVDARADIFSFGCILYECLVGEAAFCVETGTDVIAPGATGGPDWSKLPTSLPRRLAALLRQCLAPDAGDRLGTMRDARVILETALGQRATPSTDRRGPDEAPNNLPQPVTSFVGRERALREVSRRLDQARLVTLTGPGGCGKTRLAVELATGALRRFSDGVYLVELVSTCCPETVAGTVAAAIGIKDRPHRTTTDVLCEHLADRTFLLILDNCEHVLDGVSELIARLLPAAQRLRILATSREPLHLPGEQVWPVPSLTLPEGDDLEQVVRNESVSLFVDRARSVRPDFTLTPSNARVIARLCRRLDGIPLAIELAAARVRTLTPQEIDQRLDDRFRLLETADRGVAMRHRTLRAAVDWSYRMLSESEKRMLRALSVFAGGWTFEGALAVCGPDGRVEDGGDLDELGVLDLLTHLADKSLLMSEQAGDESRYRLLETVRDYAAEELDAAGEGDDACSRHLAFYLALLEQAEPELTGSRQAAWLERLAVEHENLLAALGRCETLSGGATAALRLCRAAMRFWLVRGHFRTGLEASLAALRLEGAQTRTTDRASALHAAGVMAQALGDYGQGMRLALEALDILREHDDRPGIARTLNSLGNLAYYQGDLREAQRRHEESLALNQALQNAAGVATSLNNLANVAHDRGRLREARRLYEEALTLNRRSGNRAWEAINLNNLGIIAYRHRDLHAAARLHEESLDIRRRLGDRHGIAESLGQLARVARAERDLDQARTLLAESLRILCDVGDRLGLTDCLEEIALVAADLDEPERAAALLGAAANLRDQLGAPRPESDRKELDACVLSLRRLLGRAALEGFMQDGRQRPLEASIRETRTWLPSENATPVAQTRLAGRKPTSPRSREPGPSRESE